MKTNLRVIALLFTAACADDAAVVADATSLGDVGDTADTTVGDVSTDEDATADTEGLDVEADVADDVSGADAEGDVSDDTAVAPNAALRAIHLAGGAGAVDLWVGGEGPVVAGLGYSDGTAFQPVVGGALSLDVVPTGKTPSEAVLSSVVDVPEAGATSVAVVAGSEGLSLISYASDRAEPAAGRVRVRFIHTAALGTVDVWEGDALVADDLDFGSLTAGVDVPSGARRYLLDTTLDGVAEWSCKLGVFPAGTIADVFITGSSSTGSADAPALVVWFDNGATVDAACEVIPVVPDESSLRVLHAAADVDPIDATYASTPVAVDFAFGVGGAYVTVPALPDDLVVTLTGASEPALNVALAPEPNASTSVIVTGADTGVTAIVVDDDRTPPEDGTTSVRVVHAFAGRPSVSARVGAVDLATSLPFGQPGDTSFIGAEQLSPEGVLEVEVTWEGGEPPALSCVLPALPAGAVVTVVLTRAPGGDDTEAIVWAENGVSLKFDCAEPPPPAKADLRSLHLAPNVGAVDVVVGDAVVAPALSFPSGTAYASVLSGETTLSLAPAGLTKTISLADGASYSAIALETAAGADVVLLTDDRSEPAAGRARLRAFHGAPGVPTVDLYAGSQLVFSDLAFGTASAALEVDAAELVLGVDTTQDGALELICALPALAAGDIVTAAAAPASGGGVQLVLWFDDGSTATAACEPPPVPSASVRALNLLSGLAPLSVTRGSTTIATGLASWTGSAYVTAPTTAESVVVTSFGGVTLATGAPTPLVSGNSYTAVALGPTATPSAVLFTDDLSAVPAGQVRVRFVHAIPGFPAIDIYATPTPTTKIKVTGGLTLGKAGGWLQGANSPATSGVDVGADGKIDWSCPKVPLVNQSVTSIYFVLQSGILTMAHHGDTGSVLLTPCTAGAP